MVRPGRKPAPRSSARSQMNHLRYRLRTLLIVLTVLPPLLAVGWWKYADWKPERERQRAVEAQREDMFRLQLLRAEIQLLRARVEFAENLRAFEAQIDQNYIRALTAARENDYQAAPRTYQLLHYGPSENQ